MTNFRHSKLNVFADDDLQRYKKWQKILQIDGKNFVFSKDLFCRLMKTQGLFGKWLKKHAVVDGNQFNVKILKCPNKSYFLSQHIVVFKLNSRGN